MKMSVNYEEIEQCTTNFMLNAVDTVTHDNKTNNVGYRTYINAMNNQEYIQS